MASDSRKIQLTFKRIIYLMNIGQNFKTLLSLTAATAGLHVAMPVEVAVAKQVEFTGAKLEMPVAEKLTNLKKDEFHLIAQAAPTPTPQPTTTPQPSKPNQPEKPSPHRGSGRRELVLPSVSPATFNHTANSAFVALG